MGQPGIIPQVKMRPVRQPDGRSPLNSVNEVELGFGFAKDLIAERVRYDPGIQQADILL